MKPVIDFGECVRDSPRFRSELEDQLHKIDNLDGKLEKLLKASGHMIDAGKAYVNSQHVFINAVSDVALHYRQDASIYSSFNKCCTGLIELAKFHSTLLDQVTRAICRNMADFLKKEVRSCKEMKSYLEKLQQDFDGALQRNSAVPKGKNVESEEALNAVSHARINYRSAAVDTVYTISLLQQKKRFEVLDDILSVMQAYKTYFHQGYDFFKDADPFMKNLSSELSSMRSTLGRDAESLLANRESLIQSTPDYVSSQMPGCRSGVLMQGYLFKRGSGKTFKSWKRRWFELLERGQLVYRKKIDELPTVMEEDLRICLVRPMAECDRRFLFELISPSKTHILQADREEVANAWVSALQVAISSAIQKGNDTMRSAAAAAAAGGSHNVAKGKRQVSSAEKSRILQKILGVKGNDRCCDCGADTPEWASGNLGITLCIECSGIHRSLGVHHSKVKSLHLDSWEPGLVKLMCELGNDLSNRIYLAKVEVMDGLQIEKATPTCPRDIRETWIRAKYVDKAFVAQPKISIGSIGGGRRWSVRRPRRKTGEVDLIDVAAVVSHLPPDLTTPPPLPTSKVPQEETQSETDSYTSFQSTVEGVLDESGNGGSDQELERLKVVGSDLTPSHMDIIKSTDGKSAEEVTPLLFEEEVLEALDPNLLLFKSSRSANLGVMLEAVALGADKNWVNYNSEAMTPLHQAVLGGSITACEFLILNGGRVNALDGMKRTPLWLASEKGHTGQVCLFLRNRADYHLVNVDGRSPLEVAVIAEHADIVTLLRLAQMDEEMRRGESNESDDTFQEIVRDIALKAQDSQDPSQEGLVLGNTLLCSDSVPDDDRIPSKD